MTALFNARAPIFYRAYVCRAYEALAVAVAYVSRANTAIDAARDADFDPQIAALLAEAEDTVESGFALLKNEKGADDTGPALPLQYNAVRLSIVAAARFYAARYISTRPRMHRQAYEVMAAALALDACGSMRAEMQAIADAVATMESNVALKTLASGFVSSIAMVVAPRGQSQTVLLAKLLSLPRPEAPDLAGPKIMPMPADEFLRAVVPTIVEEEKSVGEIK